MDENSNYEDNCVFQLVEEWKTTKKEIMLILSSYVTKTKIRKPEWNTLSEQQNNNSHLNIQKNRKHCKCT